MNADDIEQMNAHGPYDHGVWQAVDAEGTAVAFGGASLFTTRSEVMCDKIIEFLRKTYTASELSALSIVDVGCYDGWVLNKIATALRFKRAVGVEPRQKNIDKGAFARKVCRVETSCQFIQGGHEDLGEVLGGEVFDIVLCLGMFHHVGSVEQAIKNLSAVCGQLLIVDSMVIPPLSADYASVAAVINPIDIVYRNKEKLWGLAAYKMESPYFDGSTSGTSLVNIPEERLIRLCLQTAGFSPAAPLMTEKDFYPKDFQALRGVSEVMLAAFRDPSANTEEAWRKDAREYEALFCLHVPTTLFVEHLRSASTTPALAPYFASALGVAATSGASAKVGDAGPELSAEQREIASTIPRGPYEKTLLELAKLHASRKERDQACMLLQLITTAKNADWRSFYRACFLLSVLEARRGNHARAQHYEALLTLSNPLFPRKELEALCEF